MILSVMMGTEAQAFELTDENLLGVLEPNEVEVKLTGEASVRNALDNPIGTKKLTEIVKPGEKVVIVTSDITRPLPSYQILPILLDELENASCRLEDITVVFALGSHRQHTVEEQRKLVGYEVFDRVRCVDCDLNDVVHLGTTKGGTPVDIVRIVAEADHRIGIGNIEYHYFAGYSGGAKAIMPGVSTREAIQANHSRMVEPGATTGSLDGNPLRQDIEEAVRDYCPLDCIVNVVLNESKEIIYTVFGDFVEAHRVGCRFLDQLYRVEIPERADIVIVSQGGAPKDLNLYQTQKALENAKHAVKNGGIIILVGSCREGMGEAVFERWMTEAEQPEDLLVSICENFQLGGHKAAAIALVLENSEIFLVSEMEEDFVRSIFMTPFSHVQTALNKAFSKLSKDASVLVMPYGGSTLPHVVKETQV